MSDSAYEHATNNLESSFLPDLEHLIRPAVDFFTPKPIPKAVDESEVQTLSSVPNIEDVTSLTNQNMVSLRLAFADLGDRGYTMADYEEVELWVEREQADKLNELLKLYRPGGAKLTGLIVQRRAKDKNRAIFKWLKREPQRRLMFWDAEDVIEQLQAFDFSKNLTIFDLVTLVDRVELSLQTGLPLQLGTPPSHVESCYHMMQGPASPADIPRSATQNKEIMNFGDESNGQSSGWDILASLLPDLFDGAGADGVPQRTGMAGLREFSSLPIIPMPEILGDARSKRKLEEDHDAMPQTKKKKVSHEDSPQVFWDDGTVMLSGQHILSMSENSNGYSQASSGVVSNRSTILGAVPEWIPNGKRFKMPFGLYCLNNFDITDPRDYAKHLSEMCYPRPIAPYEMRYASLPPIQDTEALNRHLNEFSLMCVSPPLPLFRDFEGISPASRSVLARCVRFAKSHAQLCVDWRLYPMHVYAIMLRTNPYGMELLVSRTEIDSLDFRHTTPMVEFEVLAAVRTAHARYAQGCRTMYLAADVPELVDSLRDNHEEAATVLHLGHAQRYGIIVWSLIQENQELRGNIQRISPEDMEHYTRWPLGF